MISTIETPSTQTIEDLASAIREQVLLERQAQEIQLRALAQHDADIAALYEKNQIASKQVDALQNLSEIVGELNIKVSELHSSVMNYTQGYINDHHIPLSDQLRALHARVEVILQFLSALAPSVMGKDDRIQTLQAQLLEFLRHPMTGSGGVIVNTGDSNVRLKSDGDMSRMNVTGKP